MHRLVPMVGLIVSVAALSAGFARSAEAVCTSRGAALPAGVAQPAQASSPGTLLLAYIEKINRARQPYVKAAPALEDALSKLSNSPGPTWVTAAQKVQVSQGAARHLAVRVAAIKPPAGLTKAHAHFLKSAQLAAKFLGDFRRALVAKDVAAVQRLVSGFAQLQSRIGALVADWRIAVTAAARAVGVKLPAWVETLGSG